jgi:hypothetical protein
MSTTRSRLSEVEEKRAIGCVLSDLRKKDLSGLLAAQREGRLNDFMEPHLNAYIEKKYPAVPEPTPVQTSSPPRNEIQKKSFITPPKSQTPVNFVETPVEPEAPAVNDEPDDLSIIEFGETPRHSPAPSMSPHPDEGAFRATLSTSKGRRISQFAGTAMEVGCEVWAKPNGSDEWVKAIVRSINPVVIQESKFRTNKTSQKKSSIFVLDLQNDAGDIIDEFKVESSPVEGSLEEYEFVKLRNIVDDEDEGVDVIEDLITLSYLHEPAILSCLRKRFERDLIYTNTGPILIAVVSEDHSFPLSLPSQFSRILFFRRILLKIYHFIHKQMSIFINLLEILVKLSTRDHLHMYFKLLMMHIAAWWNIQFNNHQNHFEILRIT